MGAIGLGYLLAIDISHFVGALAAPIAGWVSRKEYGGMLSTVSKTSDLPGFSLQDSLPELARFIVLLLVWYAFVRWLYFKPVEKEVEETAK